MHGSNAALGSLTLKWRSDEKKRFAQGYEPEKGLFSTYPQMWTGRKTANMEEVGEKNKAQCEELFTTLSQELAESNCPDNRQKRSDTRVSVWSNYQNPKMPARAKSVRNSVMHRIRENFLALLVSGVQIVD
jgi:hypothetical protein